MATPPAVGFLRRGPDIPPFDLRATTATPTNVLSRFAGVSGSQEPSDGALAVGESHVLQATNAGVAIFDKAGRRLYWNTLASFFGGPITIPMNDPRALYDSVSRRWYVLAFTKDSTRRINDYYIAISETSDPTAGWCQFIEDQSVVGGVSGKAWADFPGFGVDHYGFYISAVRFPFVERESREPMPPIDTRIQMISRQGFDCSASSVPRYDWTLMEIAPDGRSVWAFQPHIAFGDAPAAYLAGASSRGGSYVEILSLSHAPSPLLSRRWVRVSSYLPPLSAAQKGSLARLDFGDARVPTSPVYRDGSLWIAHSALATLSAFAGVRWYEIKVATVTVGQSGEVWNDALSWGYPALMVDAESNVVLLAAYSGLNDYPGANVLSKARMEPYFIGEAAGFGAGGLAPYVGEGTQSQARWGDYFGIALDPDGRRVWVEATYSLGRTTWGTTIGAVTAGSPLTATPAPTPSPTTTPLQTPTPTPAPSATPPLATRSARSVLLESRDAGSAYRQTDEKQSSIQQQAENVPDPSPYRSALEMLRAWGFIDSWSRTLRSDLTSGVYAIVSQATSYSTLEGAKGDYELNLKLASSARLKETTIGTTVGDGSAAYRRDFTTPSATGVPTEVTELFVVFRAGLISSTLDIYAYRGELDDALAVRLANLQAKRSTAPLAAPIPRCASSTGPGIPPPTNVTTGIPGFHAAWYGQSGYPTLCPGQQATATVAFLNTGSFGWFRGASGQTAYLGTWNPEPGQDRASALGGDGTQGSPNTGWPAFNRIAIQPASYVGPGQVAWFQFVIQAPRVPGTYRLALRPLIEGATWLEDYGVFWYVVVVPYQQ